MDLTVFDGRESIYIEFYLGNSTWIPYAKLPICSKYSAVLLVISSIFLNNKYLFLSLSQLLLSHIFANI